MVLAENLGKSKLGCDQKMSTQVGYGAQTLELASDVMGINGGTLL